MPRVNALINNFSTGEISPRARRRSDLQGFFSAAEFQRNFISDYQGGLRYRPGSKIISTIPQNARLLPFVFDELDTYLIEVGDTIIRFARSGEYVASAIPQVQRLEQRTNQLVVHVVSTAAAGFQFGSTASLDGIRDLNYQRFNKVSYFYRSNTSSLDGAWTEFIFDIPGLTVVAPFVPASTDFITPVLRIHHKVDSPYNSEEIDRLKYAQRQDTMFLACGTKPLFKIQRTNINEFLIQPHLMFDNNTTPRRTRDSDLINFGFRAFSSGWTTGTGWTHGTSFASKTAGTASALSQVAGLVADRRYRIKFRVRVNAGTVQPRFTGGTTVNGTVRSASGVYEQELVALSGNTTVELFGDAAFAGQVWGITVSEVGQTPYCVELYESRLFKAHTDFQPGTIWASRSFIFDQFNFQFSNADGYPAATARLDSDPIEFTVANPNSDIVHMLGAPNFLYLGTLGGGIAFTGGSPGAGITATSVNARILHRQGSILTAPAFAKGADNFFVEFDQRKLRKLEFSFDRDRFFPMDISLAVDHFGQARFLRGTAKSGTDEKIMLVDASGDIACSTYDAELQQNSWYKLEAPNGFRYLDICALPTPQQEDTVYTIIIDENGNKFLSEHIKSISIFSFGNIEELDGAPQSMAEAKRKVSDQDIGFFARLDSSYVDFALGLEGNNRTVFHVATFGAATGNTTVTVTHPLLPDDLFVGGDVGRKIKFINNLSSFVAEITAINSPTSANVTITGTLPKLSWLSGVEWALEFKEGETLYAGAHLIGRNDVALEIDGVAYTNISVDEYGNFEAPQDGALFRAGLTYRGLWKSVNMAGGSVIGTSDSLPKNISYTTLAFLKSSRFKIGTDFFNLEEMTFEGDNDPVDIGTPLFTGEKRINLKEDWQGEKHVYLVKDTPGPLQVLSLVPHFNVGND